MLQVYDCLYKYTYRMYIYQHLLHMHGIKPRVTDQNASLAESSSHCLSSLPHKVICWKAKVVISFFPLWGLSRIIPSISALLVSSYSIIHMGPKKTEQKSPFKSVVSQTYHALRLYSSFFITVLCWPRIHNAADGGRSLYWAIWRADTPASDLQFSSFSLKSSLDSSRIFQLWYKLIVTTIDFGLLSNEWVNVIIGLQINLNYNTKVLGGV